nr:proline-rich protein 36-like [Aegilops tauschii subsp. strangulata]
MPLTLPVAAPPRLRPLPRRHLADAPHLPASFLSLVHPVVFPELSARSIHGRPDLPPHVVVVGLLAFGHLSDPPASSSASPTPPRASLAQLQGSVSPLPFPSSSLADPPPCLPPTRALVLPSTSPHPPMLSAPTRAHLRRPAPTTAITRTLAAACAAPAPHLDALAAPQARPYPGLPQLSPAQTPAHATASSHRPAAAHANRAQARRRARRLLCLAPRNPPCAAAPARLRSPRRAQPTPARVPGYQRLFGLCPLTPRSIGPLCL